LRGTAWWGWEDSNFQPNDYQPPALSIEQSGANQIGGRQSEKAFRRMKLVVGEFFFLQAGVTFADKVFARFKLGNFNIRILPWLIQQP
jgi:hypothetical protein